MMKYLLIALFLSTTANAAMVKSPSCGVGKMCVSDQYTCPIKNAVKKPKKLYKAAKQTVIPAPIIDEPCEIIQYHYHDVWAVNNDYLGKLPRDIINNATRPQESVIFPGYNNSSNSFFGGTGSTYNPITNVIVFNNYDCVECCIVPPITSTPLPSPLMLLLPVVWMFRGRFNTV